MAETKRYIDGINNKYVSTSSTVISETNNNTGNNTGDSQNNGASSTGASGVSGHYSAGYYSAEEAAAAFGAEVYSASNYIRHEYVAEIYSVTYRNPDMIGQEYTLYYYTEPRVGEPHKANLNITKETVAFVHTHPTKDSFSGIDKDGKKDGEGDLGVSDRRGIDAYMIGPTQNLWYYESGGEIPTDPIGKITPTPLSDDEKKRLVAEYQDSWNDHILKHPNCQDRIWPNP